MRSRKPLLEILKEKTGIPEYLLNDLVRVVFDSIGELLENGQNVVIWGFGTFHLRWKQGHHVFVRDGKMRDYPPFLTIRFRPSRRLKKKVNKQT